MKSLHKALDIIETISQLGSVGVREISTIKGFPPATSHRILATLTKRGYLEQDPTTKNYSLSIRFLELGTRVRDQSDLYSIARPHLQKLMSETGETANLVIRDGDSVVYVDQVQSDKSRLAIFTQLGARAPLYSTGVGKMILSQWSEEELEAYFRRTDFVPFTKNTILNQSDLTQELDRICIQGFSEDNEETEEGVRCVAALIYDHRQQVVGAVSISGVAMRITTDRVKEFGERVKQCAHDISRDLGFQPPLKPKHKEENDA
jgi:DNA-binding IclR family transcriptional regulator